MTTTTTTEHTMTERTAYQIPAEDLTVGQIVRSRQGTAQVVVRVITAHHREIVVDLASLADLEAGKPADVALTAVATFTVGADHVMTTWLDERQAHAPGLTSLDGEDFRCGTCDSRHCGWESCHRPWLNDTYTRPLASNDPWASR